tara:strand:- start:168 stop:914 length:747 start_codon:yes stop_codon:yes gene_type:complete
MEYLYKNSIIFIILISFLIYFLFFLNFKNIIKSLSNKEHLVNLYKPNKVFYHNNKIYIMDTHHIIDDENPKIFNTFEDFRKYILELEDKNLIKLPLKLNDIKNFKNKIKDFNFDIYKKKTNTENDLHFKESRECFKKSSLCELDPTSLDKNKITLPQKLCKNKIFTEDKCKEYIEILKKDKLQNNEMFDSPLNKKCYIENTNSNICKKYNKLRWNMDIINNFCVKDKNEFSFESCLYNKHFKENIMDF